MPKAPIHGNLVEHRWQVTGNQFGFPNKMTVNYQLRAPLPDIDNSERFPETRSVEAALLEHEAVIKAAHALVNLRSAERALELAKANEAAAVLAFEDGLGNPDEERLAAQVMITKAKTERAIKELANAREVEAKFSAIAAGAVRDARSALNAAVAENDRCELEQLSNEAARLMSPILDRLTLINQRAMLARTAHVNSPVYELASRLEAEHDTADVVEVEIAELQAV